MGWTFTNSRTRAAARLAAACVAGALFAVPATASLGDFRLPPQQEPPPNRQGPVAPDVPESRRPAPTPTPTAARVTPTPAPAPDITPFPAASDSPAAQPTSAARSALPTTRPAGAPPTAADTAPLETDTTPAAQLPSASTTGTTPSAVPTRNLGGTGDDGGSTWPWILGALLALAALGLAGWVWWRRQQRPGAPVGVPQIERPRVGPALAPVVKAPIPATAAPVEPLQVRLEPLKLSLTLINATLSYHLEIANHGAAPITDLRIGADMISAHASMSREQQLAGPAAGPRQRIERLEPGESRVVSGEFRVPFSQIVPIRQGSAALLLPLARFRVEAAGAQPVVRTFVVGQPGDGAGLQPFRLDQGPRIYPRLAQRAFA